MLVILSVFAFVAQDPVVTSGLHRGPNPWTQGATLQCGQAVVQFSGFGPSSPEVAPGIESNGRQVTGEKVTELHRDLGRRSAVYRIGALCGPEDQVYARIDIGERQADGTVRYESASAVISGGALTSYTGLAPSTADSFWFR